MEARTVPTEETVVEGEVMEEEEDLEETEDREVEEVSEEPIKVVEVGQFKLSKGRCKK